MTKQLTLRQPFKNLNGEDRINRLKISDSCSDIMLYMDNGPNKHCSFRMNKAMAEQMKAYLEEYLK